MKSVSSIQRCSRKLEALQRKAQAKKNSQRARLLLDGTIAKKKQEIIGLLRDLGLTRLQLTAIAESLRYWAGEPSPAKGGWAALRQHNELACRRSGKSNKRAA